MQRMRLSYLVVVLLTAGASAQTKPADLNGQWTGQFADSVKSGAVTMDLTEKDGKVSGKYRLAAAVDGLVSGTLEGSTFNFTLANTVPNCPGTFTGTLTINDQTASGQYTGKDCVGAHSSGVLSLTRGGASASANTSSTTASSKPEPPLPIHRDKKGRIGPQTTVLFDGRTFWVSDTGEYMIALADDDSGEYYQLHIAVLNRAGDPVDFIPSAINVVDGANAGKSLKYYPPDEIARRIRRRAAWASAFQNFGNSMAAAPRTSNQSGNLTVRDQYGNTTYGSYSGTTTTQPDYGKVNQQAAQNTAANRAAAERQIQETNLDVAKANTLFTGRFVAGTLSFARPKRVDVSADVGEKMKSHLLTVFIPLGKETFFFPMPIDYVRKYNHHLDATQPARGTPQQK